MEVDLLRDLSGTARTLACVWGLVGQGSMGPAIYSSPMDGLGVVLGLRAEVLRQSCKDETEYGKDN